MELLSILWSDAGNAGNRGGAATNNIQSTNFASPYFSGMPQHFQTGICSCHSWEFSLFLSFISLVLWSILLATLSSVAMMRNEHDRKERERKLCQKRLDFVRHNIRIKRIRMEKNRNDPDESIRTKQKSGNGCVTRGSTSDDSLVGEDFDSCSICLEDFKHGDEICESRNCRHKFHMNDCMCRWLLGHDECPICRRDYILCERGSSNQRAKTKDSHYYVEPVAINDEGSEAAFGIATVRHQADERWRFRESGLSAMSEFPPWFW
ncbi:ring finger domain containing protein [Nitzschia inconspicua]|uniref:Ring finger domain containing protein n=1 Tax=Nitzschia inconspicua TaxID=303405 RepID=A0A9K3LYX9_9STRA|nr:ring finger domain containing protein [Nitzschia inconspicua]